MTFEVELINIGDSAPTTNVFKEIDADADKMLSREEVSEYLKKQMVSGGRSVVKVHYVTVTAEEGELLQSPPESVLTLLPLTRYTNHQLVAILKPHTRAKYRL